MMQLFTTDAWQNGASGPGGLLGSLSLAILVVVGLLLIVLNAARRLETNSDAARRAWGGGIDARSLPQARVVHDKRR
jgi:hypothetical protein